MNGKDKKIKSILIGLSVIEYVYLLSFFFVIFAQQVPVEEITLQVSVWLTVSYMLLPLLLFKNVLVAILNGGVLTKSDKIWMIVRCAVYLILAIIAYPLITSVQ